MNCLVVSGWLRLAPAPFRRVLPALLLFVVAVSPTRGETLSVTEPLVGGTAVFAPFDDLGGLRTLNFATVAVDAFVDVTTGEISNDDPSAPTTIDLTQGMSLSWAPDDPAYHSEPTDSGSATETFTTTVMIPAGEAASGSAIHLLPTLAYDETTYDFNETYGVRLLTAITSQLVTVTSGAGLISPVSTLVMVGGTATVTYDYTRVPEPSGLVGCTLAVVAAAMRRRRC